MGIPNSKPQKSSALKLCKERKKQIKQAIESRYALAAAHVSYVGSLQSVGTALRRYAEAQVLIENSDKTPSHSSYPSPSPSQPGISESSPISPLPSAARVSYMKSGVARPVTVTVTNPIPRNSLIEENDIPMPPPPPPPPDEAGASWDYFDPPGESFRFAGQNGSGQNMEDEDFDPNGNSGEEGPTTPKMETPRNSWKAVNGPSSLRKNKSSVEKDDDNNNARAEREDPSEFVTHRAKDFLSSIKDIVSRFFRASESGKEVSRMLESSKIHVGYGEARGASSGSICLAPFGGACCQSGITNVSDDQLVTKVITWKRTTSSKSSSSRNPLATRDDVSESGSDFIEEFCMISGSHSSTLDRLYAWERKLYDEVKASEIIQKEYDRKCDQLRHQFAKDLSPQVIDKTRAVVKDLHSRIRVALHSVDTISKRIEKIRDDELLPQLLELINGLTKMWKAMLECHHSQYITISLAYHAKVSAVGETQRQILSQLEEEVEYFGLGFADWVNSYTSYVEALNSWLQNCILQPRERHKGRRALSPRRYLAPSIFVLCRDWSVGIKSLPSQEVSDAVNGFLSDLRSSVRQQRQGEGDEVAENNNINNNNNSSNDNGEDGGDGRGSVVRCVQGSLSRVLDRLTKFSEGSVKVCEDVLQKCELARNAYDNYKAPPRSFSI